MQRLRKVQMSEGRGVLLMEIGDSGPLLALWLRNLYYGKDIQNKSIKLLKKSKKTSWQPFLFCDNNSKMIQNKHGFMNDFFFFIKMARLLFSFFYNYS